MTHTQQGLLCITLAALLGGAVGCAPTEERRSAGQFVDDSALTARVKTAMIKAGGVDANAVNVNTYRDEVVLSGFVENPEMVRRAGEIARGVEGVRVVRNDLRVTPKR